MTVADRLTDLVTRIEASSLPESQKQEIYLSLRDNFRKVTEIGLMSHVSQEELKKQSENPSLITAESITKLFKNTLETTPLAENVSRVMHEMLDEVEKQLLSQGILPKTK